MQLDLVQLAMSLRGGPFDFWGGVEENVPEHFIYFFPVGKQIFYFTSSEKQFFFLVCRKDETIFFSTYFCEPTHHTGSFDDNMSNSVGSLVM